MDKDKEIKAPPAMKPEVPKRGADLQTVENWRDKKGTPVPVYAGTCVTARWKPGKQITEQEYDAAVKGFRAAPAGKEVNHVR